MEQPEPIAPSPGSSPATPTVDGVRVRAGVAIGAHAARPLRFAVVGAITFGLQIGLLTLLTDAGLESVASYAIALAICVQFNFVVSQLLVWHDRPLSLTARRVIHRWTTFHAFIALSLVVNIAAFVLAERFMADLAAALVALGASTVIKFLSLDRLVFRSARAA